MKDLEDRWAEVGAFIRDQRQVGRISLRKLSEMAGISNPYLSQIERGLRKPSAEILQQIARALEISAETQKVVGIQHLGGCPTYNSASRMDRIYQQISRRLQGCSNAPNCAPLSNSLCDCNGVCSGKERKFVDGGGVCADCD